MHFLPRFLLFSGTSVIGGSRTTFYMDVEEFIWKDLCHWFIIWKIFESALRIFLFIAELTIENIWSLIYNKFFNRFEQTSSQNKAYNFSFLISKKNLIISQFSQEKFNLCNDSFFSYASCKYNCETLPFFERR